MIVLYVFLGYLAIGIGYATWHALAGILTYPRVMTKGGLRRAFKSVDHFWTIAGAVVIGWPVVPAGQVYRLFKGL